MLANRVPAAGEVPLPSADGDAAAAIASPIWIDGCAYGLVQGKAMQVLSPRVALPWIKAELSAETRQRGLAGGSFLQMPGTFVIDTSGVVQARSGKIRMAHRNRDFADAPSIERLIEALAGAERST